MTDERWSQLLRDLRIALRDDHGGASFWSERDIAAACEREIRLRIPEIARFLEESRDGFPDAKPTPEWARKHDEILARWKEHTAALQRASGPPFLLTGITAADPAELRSAADRVRITGLASPLFPDDWAVLRACKEVEPGACPVSPRWEPAFRRMIALGLVRWGWARMAVELTDAGRERAVNLRP